MQKIKMINNAVDIRNFLVRLVNLERFLCCITVIFSMLTSYDFCLKQEGIKKGITFKQKFKTYPSSSSIICTETTGNLKTFFGLGISSVGVFNLVR